MNEFKVAFIMTSGGFIMNFILGMYKDFNKIDSRVISKKLKILQLICPSIVVFLVIYIFNLMSLDDMGLFMNSLLKVNILSFLFYYTIDLLIAGIILGILKSLIHHLKEWKIICLWDEFYKTKDMLHLHKVKDANLQTDKFVELVENLLYNKEVFIEKTSFRYLVKIFLFGDILKLEKELSELQLKQYQLLKEYSNKLKLT